MSAVSDFRSDTVTRPTAAMLAAIATAEVGDDVLDGDPTVRRLEERVARWLGKEGALFVPSGTMANQVAVGAWIRPGEQVVVEEGAHVLLYEAGAIGALHGGQTVTLRGEGGALRPADLERILVPATIHRPPTGLVCVEQTHMSAGGRVVPMEALAAVQRLCTQRRIPVHLDGARLANAVVASGIPADAWAARADSVAVCLSKGLGAPVGSLIAGDAAFLERARALRKRLGGWMRQAGLLAAAGLVALDEGLEHLAADHRLARDLAEALDALPGLRCPPAEVETNVVSAVLEDPSRDAHTLVQALEHEGVRVLSLDPGTLRFITHRDVGTEDVRRAAEALRRVL